MLAYGIFVRYELFLPLIFGIVVCLILGTLHLHLFPPVTTSGVGIEIPFFFHKLFIPWSDIVGVETAWFMGSVRVIKCRKITPVHWLYGLIYGGTSIYSSFLISSQIEDFHDLMREIKLHTEHNNLSTN